jgi:hypothetical protein
MIEARLAIRERVLEELFTGSVGVYVFGGHLLEHGHGFGIGLGADI